MKTALVTGGAGFIGSHVVDYLLNKGLNVVVLDNLSTGKKQNVYNKNIQFVEGDIKDKALLENVFSVHSPHYVFHLAAQISVSRSVREPALDCEDNILGTIFLLEASVKCHCEKFIFTSSGGVMYGEDPISFPTSEDEKQEPSSPYGISKMSAERYVEFFQKEYKLPYTILRYSNVFGPRQNPQGEAGVVAIFTEKMLKKETVVINGDGKYIRDYVFVEDVAKANLLSIEKGENDYFNIGTSIGTDVNELFYAIKKITGYEKDPAYGPPRSGDLRKSILDYKKAKNILEWEPQYSLEKGLVQTYDFFASRLGI